MSCITKLLESGVKTVNSKCLTIVEGGGEYKGYEFLVVLTSMGHRCGYVAINKNHPFYGAEHYDDLALNMHGGCTFYDKQFTDSDCSDKWIGFDCAHLGDAKDIEALEEYFPEEFEFHKEFEKRHGFRGDGYDVVRSKAYVIDECKSIIDQLSN